MSLWSRLFGRKPEREFVLPAYPAFCAGEERVASPAVVSPVQVPRHVASKPARKVSNRSKPFNKPKAAAKISAGVLAEMRATGFFGACTITEMDEWITSYCTARNLNIGGLTYGAIRTAIKGCSGVEFVYRRLLSDPAYSHLRNRHAARKQFAPERAWIFIIDFEPDHVEASLQPERRAA